MEDGFAVGRAVAQTDDVLAYTRRRPLVRVERLDLRGERSHLPLDRQRAAGRFPRATSRLARNLLYELLPAREELVDVQLDPSGLGVRHDQHATVLHGLGQRPHRPRRVIVELHFQPLRHLLVLVHAQVVGREPDKNKKSFLYAS